jgi:hypothetical protein
MFGPKREEVAGGWRRLQNEEQGPVVGPCEHDNEPSGSIRGNEFLD